MIANAIADAVRDIAPLPDEAKGFRQAIESRLEAAGWSLRREVPVALHGDARAYRVDLVASYGPCVGAVEFDRRTPRAKSLAKLRATQCDERVVVLRGGASQHISGVSVVSVEVSK